LYIEFDSLNYFEILKTFYIDSTTYVWFKDNNLKFYWLTPSWESFFEYEWKEHKGIKQTDIPKLNILKIEWVSFLAPRTKYWLLKISYLNPRQKPIFLVLDLTLKKISCYSLEISMKELKESIENGKLNPFDIIRK